MITALILAYLDFTKPFSICCNASDFGIGAILQQRDEKGLERVIQYVSWTLNKHERNYSTTEKKGLAIVWRINVYRSYIFGREFEVITDHKAWKWLVTTEQPTRRLVR